MLIRNQDKTELVDFQNTHIGLLKEDSNTLVAFPYSANGKGIRLGTYGSTEKAMKVLDMIENVHNVINIYKYLSKSDLDNLREQLGSEGMAEYFNEVFQMPSDDEVKL